MAGEACLAGLADHFAALRGCRRCPRMEGPPVCSEGVCSPVMLVGQAPGRREVVEGRPFVGPAGRTLFDWLAPLGLAETEFRRRVYMAAVCRCYPGGNPSGGDRVPSRQERENCAPWLAAELALLRPRLIVPVGRLAIARFLGERPLVEVVGRLHPWREGELTAEVIPLPHPSGVSAWPKREPGRVLLSRALTLIEGHSAWREILDHPPARLEGED